MKPDQSGRLSLITSLCLLPTPYDSGGGPWLWVRLFLGWRFSACSSAWSRRATGSDRDQRGTLAVLYLTAVLTLLALIYLGYAMIRPERF